MPVGPMLSYEFQNVQRDLSTVFKQVWEQAPALIRLIREGQAATEKRHEWLEDEIKMKKLTLNGSHVAGATSINVNEDKVPFHPGVVFRVETPAGAHVSEQIKVTAVDENVRNLTVERGYGGTTPVTLADNSILIPVSRPRPESTLAGEDWGREPTTEHNFTQIFDRTAKVSGSAQNIDYYGISNQLNYQVGVMLREITREMNEQIIFGRRVSWESGATGSFGGVLQYVEGGIRDATGGTVSMDVVNNIFEEIFLNGGMSTRYAMVCAPNQARKISTLMTKDRVPANLATSAAGLAVNKLYGDIPAFNGNPYEAFIVVEPNLPKDTILVLDLDKLMIVPLQGRSFSDKDASPPGADFFARRILGEYTFEVRNAATCHGVIGGLSI